MSSQLHVAFYLRVLYGGGAERAMLNLMQELVRWGARVDLLLNSVDGAYLSQVPPEVRIIDLKALRLLLGLLPLKRYLQKEQPAILISSLHYASEIAIWAKWLSGATTKVVVSEQNTLSVHARQRSSDRWSPLLAKLFYPMADGVVAVSQGVAQDLAQTTGLPLERIQVIHNPVITPAMLQQAQEPIDHAWFRDGEPPVVLGVGRLDPQKDFPTLIRAFAQVRQTRSARLMILGGGHERDNLKALVTQLGLENDVAFVGFVNNPYAYMSKADVFVLSSAWEGFGNVLVEAMAVGTPVISTDCPSGPAEILDRGKYGALVAIGDVDNLANEILNVLSGNRKPIDQTWLEQFCVKSVTQKYLQVLGNAKCNYQMT
jgi:glycosyltransferase involved in cell wall biosynthesis